MPTRRFRPEVEAAAEEPQPADPSAILTFHVQPRGSDKADLIGAARLTVADLEARGFRVTKALLNQDPVPF